MENPSNHLSRFIAVQTQVQVFHWQTRSYAVHKTLGDFYEAFSDLVDKFIETYASNPRQPLKFAQFPAIENYTSKERVVGYLTDFLRFLEGDFTTGVVGANLDLQNIVQDIVGEINRSLYLLSMD